MDDTIVKFVEWLLESFEAFGLLLILMASDIIIGTIAAITMRQISSSVSFKGMGKKCITLMAVGVCTVIGRVAKMPLGEMTAIIFCITELISIMENSARAGVPFPSFVYETLEKLRNEKGPIRFFNKTQEKDASTPLPKREKKDEEPEPKIEQNPEKG